ARQANEKLRQVPLVGEDVLGPARLQGGEILLALERPEEARQVLAKVGPSAPPAAQARARLLRGRSYMDEKHWAEATVIWEAALNEGRDSLAERGQVLYRLGVCYREQKLVPQAVKCWEECLAHGGPLDSAAAAFELADLHLAEQQSEKTALQLGRTVLDVGPDG